MVNNDNKKNKPVPWYQSGLAFECTQCGSCCSGPDEGYIWITKREAELIAEFLKITPGQLRRDYLKRIGPRSTIVEQPITKDCIFLKNINGVKGCSVYPARPNQCRTWPFWASNLSTPNSWNKVAQHCPGINRGKLHNAQTVTKKKKQKKWWADD